ncbi:MAG: DNA topoisomerase IB [Phycisphaerales bacterium]
MSGTNGASSGNGIATAGGLRYSNRSDPGIVRRRCGKGFTYHDAEGRRVDDERTLKRIESLVIPPAWTEVWICADPKGHLQAAGKDADERWQYLYHDDWRRHRNENKFDQQKLFADRLPTIRRQALRDLKRLDLSRECVLGCVIRLLDSTLVRIGSERYRKRNNSYGLTTLRMKHVDQENGDLRLQFRGKSGVDHDVPIGDPLVEELFEDLLELPGRHLFRYMDEEGGAQAVTSTDVNAYLREISGESITAKHFRTWGGTVCAVERLDRVVCGNGSLSAEEREKAWLDAVDHAAERLKNTRATCREYYINPVVLEALEAGDLASLCAKARKSRRLSGLRLPERAVWRMLGGD